MNLSPIIGVVLGMVLIIVSVLIGGDLTRYFDPASVMIVFGGVISATMVSYSFEQLKKALPMIKFAFTKPDIDLYQDVDLVVGMANIARREGLLALEGTDSGDPFLQKGLELIVDGTDPELIKDILEAEIVLNDDKDQLGIKVLLSASSFSPAFGMVGTLIGLINMLMFLSDSASLGPSMATALITTFYGVILANLFFTPMANTLKTVLNLRQTRLSMLMEGLLSIQNGENPRIIRTKMESYIAEKRVVKEVEATDNQLKGVLNEEKTTA